MPVYKNQLRTVAFQSLTAAGAANASAVSTQISLDGGAFAATANTAQQVSAGSGCWKVALTATEMNADLVVLLATSAGCVPSQRELYTESDWTSARAAKVDNLDATVSSRSTFAGTDTPGTTALLSRLTAQRSTNLDNLDAAVSSR